VALTLRLTGQGDRSTSINAPTQDLLELWDLDKEGRACHTTTPLTPARTGEGAHTPRITTSGTRPTLLQLRIKEAG
jgi:hypothetical protein